MEFIHWYCVFSYLFMFGAITQTNTKRDTPLSSFMNLLFSPAMMPVCLGMQWYNRA